MEKAVKCPVCNHEIDIKLENGYEVDWNRPFKEHTHICFCDNCKRKIRYSVKKIEK